MSTSKPQQSSAKTQLGSNTSASSPRRLRCAVYTRKSTEEGLDQEFNSLDAQREACAAFIASQIGLGWTLTPDRYDDGGISGGTMDRPALQRLLADIRNGKIDVVVVYKIDRLTRSLMDFSRIVEVFDASSVSFVSVTQQFNTTTSMGRLTLNVLLSFAQFEREVTAERIRDKIAASRKKGMWMGGRVPFGYRVEDRKLCVDENDAAAVRWMFERVVERRNVADMIRDVQRSDGVTRLPTEQLSSGKLRYLLANPIYIGKVRHKGATHSGEHAALVDDDLFAKVQAILRVRRPARRSSTSSRDVHLLSGLLFDEVGDRLKPTHAANHGKRYRYYVAPQSGWSIPAAEIEDLTISKLQSLISNPATLHDWLRGHNLTWSLEGAMQVAQQVSLQLADKSDPDRRRAIIQAAYSTITLSAHSIRFEIDVPGLLGLICGSTCIAPGESRDRHPLVIEEPISMRRRGKEQRIVIESALRPVEPDAGLVSLIGRAHSYLAALTTDNCASISDLAKRLHVNHADISRLLPLAFLSPSLTADILRGKQARSVTSIQLTRGIDLPHAWSDQTKALRA